MTENRGVPEERAPNTEQDSDHETVADPDDEQLGQEADGLTDPQPATRDGEFGIGITSANDPQTSPDMGGPT
ncbi:MAG: hypothetical protein ABWX59_01555 [Microbacteriaceae bacterium]